MKITPRRIDVISMGCSKNLIDSERLLRRLESAGYYAVHDAPDPCGEWVMVNTCGFIGDAKEESIEMILSLADAKSRGRIGKIAVMGCLSQRYLNDLRKEIPEVDRWYGKFDWESFISDISGFESRCIAKQTDGKRNANYPKSWERNLTTPPWSAYLKISEGCNRFCAFCAIPLITGRHKSRPEEEILEEVRSLVDKGVKEFNIIAQDLSSYGSDIYGKHTLAHLIDAIADIKGVEWIRLHYAYPSDFPMDVLDVMARRPNVCKYLDIALQHIADPVLENMQRHITGAQTIALIEEMRRRVPDIKIRTTLMTGFPGEGDAEFRQLLDFVKNIKFDRMGAFAYCEEEGTRAAKLLDDSIPEEIKQKRLDILMSAQEEIALGLNLTIVGKTVKVLIERHEGADAVGRTQWDSPEVDPEVIVKNCNAPEGDFIDVEICEAAPFELIGKAVLS